jgi:hypothetical protein
VPARSQEAPARQWARFLARFDPKVAALTRAALARVRRAVPGAVELVYDNYNALVIGFGPTERASEAVLSLAVYPRWVNLFFLRGASLADPEGRLRGAGSRVRHIVLDDGAVLDERPVRTLIRQALEKAPIAIDGRRPRRMVVKAVSAKQRPRRPPRRP